MARVYPGIDEALADWLRRQPLFFVATAPLSADGHVNLSPKGLDTFRVLGPREVSWLDLTGSGVETLAHLRENGRVVLLFCAFEGPPKIVRLHGRGRVIESADPDFAGRRAAFPDLPGVRSLIHVEVTRVSDSCGFGVPRMAFEAERRQLLEWAERKGPQGLREYRAQHDRSLDGLPGLRGDD